MAGMDITEAVREDRGVLEIPLEKGIGQENLVLEESASLEMEKIRNISPLDS
jgi:hypothetical protein